MGQKTNSNILRLGSKSRALKSKYFYKTAEESSLLIYQELQIKNYLKKSLFNNGLFMYNCKLKINATTICIHVSFFSGLKFVFLTNRIISKSIVLKKQNKNKNKITSLLKHRKRNKLLLKYKTNVHKKDYLNCRETDKNTFIGKLLHGLNLFTKIKYDIYVSTQNLNSFLSVSFSKNELKTWKKQLILLKRYSKNKFFKESINVILIVMKLKRSAQFAANYIASELVALKRHNYFFIFLKRAFTLFFCDSFSKINGIKIFISGRFNGAPRSKTKIILIGSVPVQTLEARINYDQAVSFSANGTFGIKLWVAEKNHLFMFLQPKKSKYKKVRKSKLSKYNYKINKLNFGSVGLKACESGLISSNQLEAARQAITRKIKRKGKLWLKIFPNMPITKKPLETRMGKGKGIFSHWVARVRGGSILFELYGVPNSLAINAFKTGSSKLPVKTKIFN